MAKVRLMVTILFIVFLAGTAWHSGDVVAMEKQTTGPTPSPRPEGFAGSASCRECHEKFYSLWSTSLHGLAMQPYTAEFARTKLTAQRKDIVIGHYRYRAEIGAGAGWVLETGPKEKKKYRIEHVLGGKNVYYFLTPLEKGRLQTLPVAYDVSRKEWFDTAASGVRHFPGEHVEEPVNWKEWPYTFNTACYSCHVSQLATNYDLKTDTYRTIWAEPGINCETCHGPSEEHNRVERAAPKGQPPKDPKIIQIKNFTTEQRNAACAPCHAKMIPLTTTYQPGDRFFDYYDITTLEDPDFYPDGRDLGENYTYTLWLMSPCAKSGRLDCLHCHTSSGRYRFKEEARANEACMPCHSDHVDNPTIHTWHKADSPGSRCISCHMPMTEFARMRRTDHSMLPPTPSATIAYKSPNACTICHSDEDVDWADQYVKEWRARDYQAPVLRRAHLIDSARKRDWSRVPEILNYVTNRDRDEIFSTSLIRLLISCQDERMYPALLKAIEDPSPLIRAAAAEVLGLKPSRENLKALLEATADDYRLVRVHAVTALAGYPKTMLNDDDSKRLEMATGEYFAFLMARPDQWTSHYNLGNYYLQRNELRSALASYATALKLEPRSVMVLVNSSIAYSRMGENGNAYTALERALKIAPDNAAANFNMGLLKAEQNDLKGAEKYLREALKGDPSLAQAAYNLSILLASDRLDEAIVWARKAFELRPDPRYGYTLAFYLRQKGDLEGAEKTLWLIINRWPAYGDAYLLLGGMYEEHGKIEDARSLYRQALSNEGLAGEDRYRLKAKLNSLTPPEPVK